MLRLLALLALILVSRVGAAPLFDAGQSRGDYDPPGTSEVSGLAASRTSPGVLWAHADSGDSPRCFALSDQAQRLAIFSLDGATHNDWEDMDIGPGPEQGISYVYIGDIGDNGTSRCNLQVYRFPEPVLYTRYAAAPRTVTIPSSTWERITLIYPGVVCVGNTELFGAQNAETLMIDSRDGALYIGTKSDSQFRVFRASAADLVNGATVNMTEVANFNIGWRATAGTIQPTGNEILVRGQIPNGGGGALGWWPVGDGQSIGDAIKGTRINVPFQPEPQGEAVSFDRNGSGYFTLSEGSRPKLWYFSRLSADGPAPLVGLVPAEADWRYRDDGADLGAEWRAPTYDDAAWLVGAAQFGFGSGEQQTPINFGGDAVQKHVTTYFRRSFTVPSGTLLEKLVVRAFYKGGMIVYLNGAEILRKALPTNPTSTTLAGSGRGKFKDAWYTEEINPQLLVPGTNTLAVEVHLDALNSPEMSFDLQLEGNGILGNGGEGEGIAEGEGAAEGEGIAEGEGMAEGESEGLVEGIIEGEGEGLVEGNGEGITEGGGEGLVEGEGDGVTEGEGEGLVEGEWEGETVCTSSIVNDAGFELGDLALSWGEEATGPLSQMIEMATSDPIDPYAGSFALRFLARDTDDIHTVGQTVALEVSRYVVTFQALRENAEVNGSLAIALGDNVVNLDASKLGGLAAYELESVELDAVGALSLLTISNPSLGGGNLVIDNLCLTPVPGEGEGEEMVEGEGEGASEGEDEGMVEVEGESITEGESEVLVEGEGEGIAEGEGLAEGEGILEGEGTMEGEEEGSAEGEEPRSFTADQDKSGAIELAELLRVIQLYNGVEFHCDATTEDGFVPGSGNRECIAHTSDYNPHDWRFSLSEVLRLVQLYNVGSFHPCEQGEDFFCPGPSEI